MVSVCVRRLALEERYDAGIRRGFHPGEDEKREREEDKLCDASKLSTSLG